MKTRIVLLGPPASGKGTQAARIKECYGIPTVSSGAMLRDEMRRGTALGLEADRITRDGSMVPDSMVLGIIESWLEQQNDRFAFDGFPRTLIQAQKLDEMLLRHGQPLDAVLYFELSFEAISERVLNRLTCERCGRSSDGKNGNSCPNCDGKMVRRGDDTPEALQQRMAQYYEKTDPLVGYYREKGLLHQLNAEAEPEAIFEEIRGILK